MDQPVTVETEHVRLLARLEELAARYETLFESAGDAILLLDQRRCVVCNERATRMFGARREQLVGATLYEFSPPLQPDGRPSEEKAIEKIQLAISEGPQSFEWEHQRRDGTRFLAEVSLNALKLDGRTMVQAIVRDISERKRAEAALVESEERFRQLAEHSLVGIYTIQDDAYTYVNSAFAEILGREPPDLIGESPLLLAHPDDRIVLADHLRRRLSGEEPAARYEYRARHKDGTLRQVEAFSARTLLNGRPAIIGNLLDITERRRAEQKLAEMLDFETLLRNLSVRLLDAAGNWLDRELERALADVCEFMDLDGATIWRLAEASAPFILTHRYRRLEGPPVPEQARTQDYFPWVEHQLKSGRTVVMSSLADLPEGAAIDRDTWARYGVKSALVCPLRDTERQLIGLVSFHMLREECSWPEESVKRLQTVAQIFANARVRSEAEEALMESEAKFRAIFENSRDAIGVSLGDKPVFVNPAFLRLFGLASERELHGRTVFDFIAPGRRGDIEAVRERRARGETGSILFETRGLRLDGSEFDLEMQVGPFELHGEWYNLAQMRDVSERKRAQQTLVASERKYRELVENANSIILRWSPDGRITFLNEFGERFFGYREAELLGRSVIGSIVPETESSGRDLRRLMDQVTADPSAYEQNVNENLKRSGERVWIAWTNKAVLDEQGRVKELLSVGTDITERREAEQKIKSAYARVAKTLDDAVVTMAKIVEMRDPYTAGHQARVAQLAAAIARELQLDPARIEQLRMAAIIHDIGKISVPAEMLNSTGRFTEPEWLLVRSHAQNSYDIVRNMNLPPEVTEAIWQHHERLDGSGYPRGLKGADIRLEAKILAVADVMEAMMAHRPYRAAHTVDEALAEIRNNSGKLYEPAVCRACAKLFAEQRFFFESG